MSVYTRSFAGIVFSHFIAKGYGESSSVILEDGYIITQEGKQL